MVALCQELVDPDIIQAEKGGFAEVRGVRYGTLLALTNKWGVSGPTIKKRLTKAGIVGIKGKNASGCPVDLYSEPAVCADLLAKKKK